MATPDELCSQGLLFEIEVPLRPNERVIRRMLFTNPAKIWFENKCSNKKRGSSFSDYFYLRNVVKDFVTSKIKIPTEGHFCRPMSLNIFEMKGGRARLFGYFPDQKTFVVVNGAETERDIFHRRPKTYDPYINQAKQFQIAHGHDALSKEQLDVFV